MKKRIEAFTLVEVALALMVVAVGILAVLGMFPAGLDQSEWSAAQTRAAFFAEEVFSGMRALAAEDDFDGFENMKLPVASSGMWDEMEPISLTATNDSGDEAVITNSYVFQGNQQHALRYSLKAEAVTDNLIAARLYIWPGEFGAKDYSLLYYTEFYRQERR